MVKEFSIDKARKFGEWYNEVIRRAEIIDDSYGAKGFYVKKPKAMYIIERIRSLLEQEYGRTGHLPAFFPTLIPEKNFEAEKEHVSGFAPEVFWVTKAGSELREFKEKLALKPTGETAIYPSFSKWIRSYRDLPVKIYQFGTVFRYETKDTKPLLREREYHWFESHCVFSSEEEALKQVKEDAEIMRRVVFEKMGIPFLSLKRPQWDKFAGAKETFAFDVILENSSFLQIGSTHFLAQNFSKAFDIQFENEKGLKEYGWQTCFGPGVSRILATLIAVHGDDKGLIIPFDFSIIQAVIVPIQFSGENERIQRKALEVENLLKKKNIKAKADLTDKTPGEKFNAWELYGVPIRIEIGPKELENKVLTLVSRHDRAKEQVRAEELIDKIKEISESMLMDLKEKAIEKMQSRIKYASDIDELEILMDAGFAAKAPFCSIEKEGEECGAEIKEKFKALVRGSEFLYKQKVEKKKCVVCGKEAKEIVYIAREF